jgi:hypothetical protein
MATMATPHLAPNQGSNLPENIDMKSLGQVAATIMDAEFTEWNRHVQKKLTGARLADLYQ